MHDMLREIVLDTETTGLEVSQGHRLIEIGAVELKNHIPTGETYHVRINPERAIDKEASQVHGITLADLEDKPIFADIADGLLAFLGDAKLVIHNAAFDMGFINDALIRLDYPAIADERVIDTVKLARRKFPGSPANLDALCKRFDIDASHRTSHGALIDAELLAKVYIELIGGKQQDLMLKKPNRQASTPSRVTQRPPRQFPASDAERKAHATFIDGIDQALWKQSPKH